MSLTHWTAWIWELKALQQVSPHFYHGLDTYHKNTVLICKSFVPEKPIAFRHFSVIEKAGLLYFSSQSSAAKISSSSLHCHIASIVCGRYMGRRQIPKQIPARGIMISSSGKGDGLDWLCAVSFSLPKKVFFALVLLILAAHVANLTPALGIMHLHFAPGESGQTKYLKNARFYFFFFIDNWEKWKIILNFHCHTYLQFDLFMITCCRPPSSPSSPSNCTPCRGRAYQWQWRIANNITGPWPAVGEHRRNWAPLLCRSHLIFRADSGCGNLCLHLFKSTEIKESRPTHPPPPLPPAASLLPLFTSASGFIQSSAWVLSPLTRLNHGAH